MPAEAPRPRKGMLKGKQSAGDPLPKQRRSRTRKPRKRSHRACGSFCCARWLGRCWSSRWCSPTSFCFWASPTRRQSPSSRRLRKPSPCPWVRWMSPETPICKTWLIPSASPVMALYGGLSMQRARVFDTAFSGGYARRVTLTYAFEDGAQLTVESTAPPRPSRFLAAATAWMPFAVRAGRAGRGTHGRRRPDLRLCPERDGGLCGSSARRGMRRSSPACSGRQP